MNEFDALLEECLEALREGRWDVAECLRHYPRYAAELRPRLLAASAVLRVYDVQPTNEFSTAARERFLVASGQTLSAAYDVEPEPSFFAAARVRFLMAAHRMTPAEGFGGSRVVSFVEQHFRAFAGAAAALLLFFSFSTYTVASAASALPGDWQYPVKLQTERVRLALAFGDDAKRHVRLDRAEERAHEIEEMAKRKRTIGPDVIERLVDQTKPLVDDADADWNTDDLARLQTVSAYEQAALQQAQPHVDASAQGQLTEAVQVTLQGVTVSNEILAVRDDAPPAVVTPHVPLSSLEGTATPTPTETATATPESSETPGTSQTPEASSTSDATPESIPTGVIEVNPTPETERNQVSWIRVSSGRITTLVPSAKDGWYIIGVNGEQGLTSPSPTLMRLSNLNGTSLITVNTTNGDMYWFIAHGNKFDEVQMRIQQPDGSVLIADSTYLRAVYGDDSIVPLFVLDNIQFLPQPQPTPEPSPPAASPTP